ncbi:MAG: RibD family protein [Chloroflexota bacterium]
MQKRPYVLVNMAMTADGKIDTVERRGARISGPADGARVDRLRAATDAIMVGGHTLLQEDPRLTVKDRDLEAKRVEEGRTAQPMKIGVVTRIGLPGEDGSLPQDSRFLNEGGGRVSLHTTTRTSQKVVRWLESQGAEVQLHDGQRVDLTAAVKALRDEGVEHLMVEGGSTLVSTLLLAGLVDELQLAVAPLVFGGADAPTPVGGPGLDRSDAIDLTLESASPDEDGDVVLRYLVNPRQAS